MKNYISKVENEWLVINEITITEEQQLLLNDRSGENIEAIKILFSEINNLREIPATEDDALICKELYVANKPVLNETDSFELIAVNISVEDSFTSGIINCRINGEHTQVRFLNK